jgi:hypothetical protein
MMKADVGAPVEGDRLIRRLDLPQGDNLLAVRDECRGIFRPLANDASPQTIAEEAAGALEISDAQTDVIDAACGRCSMLCHGILLWSVDLVDAIPRAACNPAPPVPTTCAQRPRRVVSLPRIGRLNAAQTPVPKSYQLIHRALTGCRLNTRNPGPSSAGDIGSIVWWDP